MLSQCLLPHVALPSTNGKKKEGGGREGGGREGGGRRKGGRREEEEGRTLAPAQVTAVSGHLTDLGVLGEDGTMFVEHKLVIVRVTRLGGIWGEATCVTLPR